MKSLPAPPIVTESELPDIPRKRKATVLPPPEPTPQTLEPAAPVPEAPPEPSMILAMKAEEPSAEVPNDPSPIIYVEAEGELAGHTLLRQRSDDEVAALERRKQFLLAQIESLSGELKHLDNELAWERDTRKRIKRFEEPEDLPKPITEVPPINETTPAVVITRKPGQRGPDKKPRKPRTKA